MKRVKIMLSAILVMAIVGGALAFKAKTVNVCVYTKSLPGGPATTVCPSILFVPRQTIATEAENEYATTLPKQGQNCLATTVCDKFVKTIAE